MKLFQLIVTVVGVMLLTAGSAFAQSPANPTTTGSFFLSGAGIGAGLGVALTIIGAGYGFGRIGGSALESMARQPEIADKIQTAMIIIGALLEGATFFGLIVLILVNNRPTF